MKTPNLKQIYAPDTGYLLFECDQERADAAVVIWESDDKVLKEHVRNRADIHMENAKAIFGPQAGKPERQLAKTAVHGVNYGVKANTLATSLGLTRQKAQEFIDKWFKAHPNIKSWHIKTFNSIMMRQKVANIYGYELTHLGRVETEKLINPSDELSPVQIDMLVSGPLGWIGQSTVAINCTYAMLELDKLDYLQILMQVHDSVVFQVPISTYPECLIDVHKALHQTSPYADPLVIQWSIKGSCNNWGDCVEFDWSDPPPFDKLTKLK